MPNAGQKYSNREPSREKEREIRKKKVGTNDPGIIEVERNQKFYIHENETRLRHDIERVGRVRARQR